MTKAFLDTTILTDILLKKSQEEGKSAKRELERYDITELPVYAIKEFESGPLQNYCYAHNKLVDTKSYSAAKRAILKINSYMRYKSNTALRALIDAECSIGKNLPRHFLDKYGDKANLDSILCDESRLHLHLLIKVAWKKRRTETNNVVNELSCYEEFGPKEIANGALKCESRKCKKDKKECSMADALKRKPETLIKLRDSIDPASNRKEDIGRREALKLLAKSPNREMTEDICKKLGDAIFAFFAPLDSTILTTNLRDHVPLASSLGKQAKAPDLP